MDYPVSFIENTKKLLGDEQMKLFQEALQKETPVSIRINTGKHILFEKANWEQVPWCPVGYYLPQRPNFTFDPLFHAGCYYVQEASSMFLSQVVRNFITEPVAALDLCAAPGGKSTLLRDELPEGSLLVANEVMPQRAQVLAENLIKYGHPATIVTQSDSSAFSSLTNFFDFILTDVPCSGEGMFRKDEVAVKEWSEDNVNICWHRQRTIVENIWPSLKPGGILVYSTCTFNLWENEWNVSWIQKTLGAEILEVPVKEEWKITSALGDEKIPVYRFLPHRTKGEGLFMAVLRKPTDEESPVRFSKSKKKPDKRKNVSVPIPKECKTWLKDSGSYSYEWVKDRLVAIPQIFQEQWQILSTHLHVIHVGITLGTLKGKDLIPDHCLAMSQVFVSPFPSVEISYELALSYLRKEAILLPEGTPRGYVLLSYRHVPLGFVKNLGNRANNLYPQEWRIRSGFTPESLNLL